MDLTSFWLVFSAVQLAGAGYVLAAVLSWRGARFWPAPEHPMKALPTALLAVVWLGVVAAVVAVADVELARWVGTGGLMLSALASLFVLLRES